MALVLLVIHFVVHLTTQTLTKYNLARTGKIARGIIYDSEKVGAKGTIYFYYSYEVDGRSYNDYLANGDLIVGDSITILYDGKTPQTNEPLIEVKGSFSGLLHNNKNYTNFKE